MEAGLQGWRALRAVGVLAGIVIVTAWIPTGLISAMNAKHYGWFGAVEFRASEFKDAYGALTRVTVGPDLALVPVTTEARQAIYEVSPAFAELRPHLEVGGMAAKWMNHDLYPEHGGDYLAGWFIWAFRDAVTAAGHGKTPQGFIDYCRKLADEVNAACDDGRIQSTGSRSGFLSRWHSDYGVRLKGEWRTYLHEALYKQGFETIVPSSDGTDDDIRYFVDLTYDNLSPSTRATYFHKPDQIKLNVVKLDTLRSIANALRGKFYVVFCVAGVVLVIRVVQLGVQRRWSWQGWLALAVIGSALAEITINFLVHIMAFDNIAPPAFAPAYPLVQLAAILVLFDAGRAWVLPLAERVKIGEKIKQLWVKKSDTTDAAAYTISPNE